MRKVRTSVTYVLVLTLQMSVWASVTMPCSGEQRDAAQQVARYHSSSEAIVANPHAHHGEQTESSAPSVCPCCDECGAMCALSSYAILISTNFVPDLPTVQALQETGLENLPNPALRRLIRPPISSA